MKNYVIQLMYWINALVPAKYCVILAFLYSIGMQAQAPGCPGVSTGGDVTIDCSTGSCTDLTASYLNIGETTSYTTSSIPYAPPFPYTGLANPISVGTDDVWSPVVNLPFNFCFYGTMYNQCIISSNGAISFDLSSNTPEGYSAWSFSDTVPSNNLFLNTIFGIYHDMDPSLGGEVAWELIGTAPCRTLVVSYHDVPLYSCTSSTSTFQVVLYETTNVVELYVEEKSSCSGWNSGNTVIGVQDATAANGVTPPGRNTSNWSVSPSSPEAWRFSPSGASITSITWFDAATGGNVVGTTDTVNVCPTETTTYRAEVEYSLCDGSTITESDTVTVNYCPTTIDFDGVDDYVSVDPIMAGLGSVSQMGWVNVDPTFTGKGLIMGQPNNEIFVRSDKKIRAKVITNTGSFTATTSEAITTGQWIHVASVYDGSTLKLYINGEEKASRNVTGTALNGNASDYTIGKKANANNNYIDAYLQEVRVYNVALTEEQLQAQVYQAIENNGGNVKGSVLGKDISGLSWEDLILYLELSDVVTGTTEDNSNASNTGLLHNMTTAQELTAPIPYKANNSGAWTSESTWEHGNVWDIESLPNKDWAIVQITNNAKVTTTNSHTHLGLLVDAGAELEIQNDQLLENTSYLKIDGQIDLQGEAQLIQTMDSELAVTSAGYIERDQQGKADIYSYNHWSSPVSPINTTANNTDYSIAEILRDGSDAANPQAINFNTTGYDGSNGSPITIADYWIFKFANHSDDYNAWFEGHVRSTGSIAAGEGYTQKGSGTASADQNYVFTGKPNNGTIQHHVDADNMYLVGNPYPSAIDADQFILDNLLTTTGALYIWEHWGGNSHALADYQGGYATYNLTGATLAVSHPDVSQTGTGSVLPKRYVPVGQGFFVQGSIIGGDIEFNNAQRSFQRESDGNSVFMNRSVAPSTMATANPSNEINRVYFRFVTPEGAQRQLLLGVKEGMPEGFNNGYDAELLYQQVTDCSWKLEEKPLVIQTIGSIYDELELPLEIKVGAEGVCKFNTEGLQDLADNVEVYFVDKQQNEWTKLEEGVNAEFNLASGVYTDRFYVVFRIIEESLDIEDVVETTDDLVVFYQSATSAIKVVNPTAFTVQNVRLYNILGQQVNQYKDVNQEVNEVTLPTQVATGTYLVKFTYNNSVEVTKKLIIK